MSEAKPLSRWTRDELASEAERLQIEGHAELKRPQLLKAVRAALEAASEPAQNGEQGDPSDQGDQGDQGDDLSAENLERIRAASNDSLELALDDPEFTAPMKQAIRAELEQRQKREKKAARQLKPDSVQRYVVTKKGFTQIDGMLVDIPVGAVVSERSHDLDELRKAGCEFRPCKGVEIVTDQLGNRYAVAKG